MERVDRQPWLRPARDRDASASHALDFPWRRKKAWRTGLAGFIRHLTLALLLRCSCMWATVSVDPTSQLLPRPKPVLNCLPWQSSPRQSAPSPPIPAVSFRLACHRRLLFDTACGHRSVAKHNAPAVLRPKITPRARLDHSLRRLPALSRNGSSCPSRHGPTPSVSSRRAPHASPRVVHIVVPTALPDAHRPTANTDTLRRSLRTRSRPVSARPTWKERQHRPRASWLATRTRYVERACYT